MHKEALRFKDESNNASKKYRDSLQKIRCLQLELLESREELSTLKALNESLHARVERMCEEIAHLRKASERADAKEMECQTLRNQIEDLKRRLKISNPQSNADATGPNPTTRSEAQSDPVLLSLKDTKPSEEKSRTHRLPRTVKATVAGIEDQHRTPFAAKTIPPERQSLRERRYGYTTPPPVDPVPNQATGRDKIQHSQRKLEDGRSDRETQALLPQVSRTEIEDGSTLLHSVIPSYIPL